MGVCGYAHLRSCISYWEAAVGEADVSTPSLGAGGTHPPGTGQSNLSRFLAWLELL